ncbi:MAG: hypothetical protein LBP53_08950 [Candidatus Peribacteria bacterium]|jgi:nicotinic acid phosphoribosyltransferase|nr:hypothetical protein [Candidatus Peribacteria bacterium]
MQDAVKKTDKITLLTDFVDTHSGIDKVLDLKEQYRNTNKNITLRLDSGDIPTLLLEALQKQKER